MSSTEPLEPTGFRFHWKQHGALATLLLFSALLLFFQLGEYKSLASHEVFVAVPAREMLKSGDWLVPRFGDLPRLQKPPLAYWIVAGISWPLGDVKAWTVRLPSAISAFLLVLVIGKWVTRHYGRVAGFWAALAQASSAYVVTYGRKAEVDMTICLMTTLVMLLLIDEPKAESRRLSYRRWCLIFLCCGITWLAKFHFGVSLLAVTLITWIVQRRFSAFLNLLNPAGLVIFLACVFVWPMLVLRELPDAAAIWTRETVGRAAGGFGHEPIWYYLPQLLTMTLPWGIVAVQELPRSWYKAWREGNGREQWLWAWLIMPTLLISALPGKHANYLIPVLPVVAIFAGRAMSGLVQRFRRPQRSTRVRLLVTSAIGMPSILVGVSILIRYKYPFLWTPLLLTCAILCGSMVVALLFAFHSKLPQAGCTMLAGASGGYVIVMGHMVPACDYRAADVAFSREVRSSLEEQTEVVVYRLTQAHSGMDPLVFYLNDPVTRMESKAQLQQKLAQEDRLHVITYIWRLWELEQLGDCRRISHMIPDDRIRPPKHSPLYLVEITSKLTDDGRLLGN